jgi:spore germination protein
LLTPTSSVAPALGDKGPAGSEGLKISYTVKTGDSLASVAKKYGITKASIQSQNKLAADAKLTTGGNITLLIPRDHCYSLKPKETLWRVAKRYGTTVALLKELNHIADVTKLEAGQLIILPVSASQIVNPQY